MNAEAWTTKFQRVVAKGICPTDIYLVKLMTIDKTTSPTTIETKIHPAHIVLRPDNKCIEWHINDYQDDFLIIETSIDSENLGSVTYDNFTTIITSCCKYEYAPQREKYNIADKDTGRVLSQAQTKREAKLIIAALKSTQIDAFYAQVI